MGTIRTLVTIATAVSQCVPLTPCLGTDLQCPLHSTAIRTATYPATCPLTLSTAAAELETVSQDSEVVDLS